MIRRFLGIPFAVAVAVGVPTTASATADTDWVMLVAQAGEHGASNLHLEVDVDTRLTGAGPGVAGIGWAWDGMTEIEVAGVGANGISLTSSTELGSRSLHVPVPVSDQVRVIASFDIAAPFEPGEQAAVLIFMPNARVVGSTTTATAQSGTITARTEAGAGSTAYALADPDEPGPAATIGPAGAGALSRTATVPVGLVGGFNWQNCQGACRGAWQSPIDHGRYIEAKPIAGTYVGRPSFSGPGGRWTWDWIGAAAANETQRALLAEPVVLAWAPIGEDYRLFSDRGVRLPI